MPVTVSLEALLRSGTPRDLWPEKFSEIVAKVEENPNEKTAWVVLADWCDENDEPGMAEACRYVGRRESVLAEKTRNYNRQWKIAGFPPSVYACSPELNSAAEGRTLAEAIAVLAAKLRQHHEDGK